MGLIVAIALLVAVVAVVGLKLVEQARDRWERVAVDGQHWRVVNRTHHAAIDVRLRVRGDAALASGAVSDLGDVGPGEAVDVRLAAPPGKGAMVVVTWSSATSSSRRMWTAPLP